MQNLTFALKFLSFLSAAVRTYVCIRLRSSQPNNDKNFFAKAILHKS